MDGRKIIGEYLVSIATQLGSVIDFDSGVCSLFYGQSETLTIEVATGSDVVVLYTPVLSLYNTDSPSIFKKLMCYALLGRNTSGCVLGFDEDARKLILSHQDDINRFDRMSFEARLLAFVEEANKVRASLAKLVSEGGTKATRLNSGAAFPAMSLKPR